jgi:hypothetical protein
MEQFLCTDNENQLNDFVYPHLKGNAIVKSAFLAGYLQPDCLDNHIEIGDTQKITKDNSQEKELNNHMEIGDQKVTKDNCKEEETIDRGNICIIDKQLFR